MPILTRSSQVALKIESVEGTPEVIADADFFANSSAHDHLYDSTEVDRGVTRGTHSQQEYIPGTRMGEVHFTQELVGGAAATAAKWHGQLRAMGFAVTGLKSFSVGSYTGGSGFTTGEILSNNAVFASATKTAQFIRNTPGGKPVIKPITGTFVNTDVIYSHDGVISTTISSALSAAGYAFTPQTETSASSPPSATAVRRLDGEQHEICGSRGRGSLTLDVNQPARLKSEFRGIPVFDDGSHGAATGRPATCVAAVIAAEGAKPKSCTGLVFKIGTYSVPVLTKCEIDFGISLADRPTITTGFQASGNLAPRVGDRKFAIAIDPEYVLGATRDFIADYINGASFVVYGEIGLTTDTNGLVAVYGPKAQITGQQKLADKSGIAVDDLKLMLAGDSDDELSIWHVFGS